MSNIAHHSLAAIAAIFIVVATWTPVLTVPADPVILGTPALA